MQAFAYSRPGSLAEALDALAADDEALALAGGMTLLPTMKMRLAAPTQLVDLNGLEELRGVRDADGGIEIGALTTHGDVADASLVRERLPALAALAGRIGDPQVRNRGTLGGSIANNDPAADYPAALLALGATVVTNRREIAADDFILDMFETALEPGELVTAVRFPVPRRAGWAKFANPASRYAIVGVMVAEFDAGPRLAVTGAAGCAFRHGGFEQALAADFAPGALDGQRVDHDEFNEDLHASAAYRGHLVGVMARRAVAAAE